MIPWEKTLKNTWNSLLVLEIILLSIFIVFQFIAYSNISFSESYLFKIFDLGLESNIPTFFEVFLFMLLALSAYFCGIVDRNKGFHRREYLPWIFASILLLFLSIDEMVQIHEQLTDPIRQILNVDGFLYFAWIIPYVVVLSFLAFYFVPFLFKLPTKSRTLIISGALVFIFGAIGFEMIGAFLYSSGASGNVSYIIVSAFEEFFEVVGILIALKGMFNEVLFRT